MYRLDVGLYTKAFFFANHFLRPTTPNDNHIHSHTNHTPRTRVQTVTQQPGDSTRHNNNNNNQQMMKAAGTTRDQHNSTNNRTSKHNDSTSRLDPPRTTRDEWFATTACTRTALQSTQLESGTTTRTNWEQHNSLRGSRETQEKCHCSHNLVPSWNCTAQTVCDEPQAMSHATNCRKLHNSRKTTTQEKKDGWRNHMAAAYAQRYEHKSALHITKKGATTAVPQQHKTMKQQKT